MGDIYLFVFKNGRISQKLKTKFLIGERREEVGRAEMKLDFSECTLFHGLTLKP